MKKSEALNAIRREWLALPAGQRATQHQAHMFTTEVSGRYAFSAAGDKHQAIMTMLMGHIGKP